MTLVIWRYKPGPETWYRVWTHHLGSLSFSFSLDDLLFLVLFGFFYIELSSLRLLLGCTGTYTLTWCVPHSDWHFEHTSSCRSHQWCFCSPTCLASTAAVYSRLKLSSVIATSSRMILKSLARSNSSLRISRETWKWWHQIFTVDIHTRHHNIWFLLVNHLNWGIINTYDY